MLNISVVIPTFNPGPRIRELIESLLAQTFSPNEVLIVDSSSTDGFESVVPQVDKVRLIRINKKDFDHGGTRDLALKQTSGDFVLFITQDAMPYNNRAIECLYNAINSSDRIAAVSGRQIAYDNASRQEKLIREFNYPANSSVWSSDGSQVLGIRSLFLSDVFSIYRKSAYLDVGGFDHPIKTNEDMLIAAKFLNAGYSIGYAADAIVYHSHDLTLRQEYRRNFLIGATLEEYKERLSASEYGRGFALVKYVSFRLLKGGHILSFIQFGFNCVARLMGNRNGRNSIRHKTRIGNNEI